MNAIRIFSRIFSCSLLLVFFLSGCEGNPSGWLGTGITDKKIHLAPSSQSSVMVPIGASNTVTFSVSIALGASGEDVALSVSGLPDGVTPTFFPSVCSATVTKCPVTLTLSVGATVPIGETPITIIGTGNSSLQTVQFVATLVVLPTLAISKPTGGTITATIADINGTKITCGTEGSICSGSYASGTNVHLTAVPAPNFLFESWSGCSSDTNVCSIIMNAAKTVKAVFVIKKVLLTVNTVGSGTITSQGINCGKDCTEAYSIGTVLTLTATPITGAVTWSGCSFATGVSCEVSMNSTTTVTAKFDLVFKAATSTTPIASTDPISIAIGSLNGDQHQDIVIGNFNNGGTVSILMGAGEGTFETATTSLVGAGPNYVVIGDFNGDDDSDIAIANENADTVSILSGNGKGLFSTTTPIALGGQSLGDAPRFIAASDLNHDGKLDIVTANLNSHNVSVLLGDGTGLFEPPNHYPVGRNPHSVVIRDMNGDSKQDIVTADFSDDTVSVLLGKGDGTFFGKTSFDIGEVVGTSSPFSVAVSDVDKDGKLDIVTANSTSKNVSILLNRGMGNFGSPRDFSVGTSPRFVAMGDLDRDGNADIVTANFGSTNVSVLLGDGTGNFPTSLNFSVGGGPRSVVISDLDGDGRLDLITANGTGRNISVLLNQ